MKTVESFEMKYQSFAQSVAVFKSLGKQRPSPRVHWVLASGDWMVQVSLDAAGLMKEGSVSSCFRTKNTTLMTSLQNPMYSARLLRADGYLSKRNLIHVRRYL
jgi:hypothetical protein